MFHCNGWCFPWAVTAVAARHVTIRSVDPGLVWELIDGEGVTHYNGAPTVQLMILGHPRAHRLEAPVTTMVAAAPPSPTLFARMDELNFRVVHVYGLTETYGPITLCAEQEEWAGLPIAERATLIARRRRTRSTAAGSTRATSPSGIPRARSSSATVARTSSSRAARTSRRSRS